MELYILTNRYHVYMTRFEAFMTIMSLISGVVNPIT